MFYELTRHWYLLIIFFILAYFAKLWLDKENINTKKLFYKNNWNKKNTKHILNLKLSLIFIGLFLLLLSAWRPQWGQEKKNIQKNGLDIVFSVDVSKSMKALDFSNNNQLISRLDATKFLISNFIQQRKNDRISLVEFAGESFVTSPLTLDHSVFLNFLNNISSDDVGKQGTNLAESLEISLSRLAINNDKKRTKAIILFSDGDETINSGIKEIAKSARDKGVSIYTIGIGSEKGMPIPENIDSWGNINYKKYKGETVITKLNPDPLKEIASITDGEYFHAENLSDLDKIQKKLESLPKTILNNSISTSHKERYWYFALFGVILFIAGSLIPKNISIKNN